ncbi:hypothetical protein ABNQ38_07765 (plasmid) [Azospirillum sp. A29]|uniref:hypothetical protein n=1 Tax=Azospirillum sp. A29 TaxID=3160606 RepID=UPI00366C0A02
MTLNHLTLLPEEVDDMRRCVRLLIGHRRVLDYCHGLTIRFPGKEFAQRRQLTPNKVRAGDILLCVPKKDVSLLRRLPGAVVQHVSNSAFSHVAIGVGSGECVEAVMWKVQKNKIADLTEKYDYIVVIRHPALKPHGAKKMSKYLRGQVGNWYSITGALASVLYSGVDRPSCINRILRFVLGTQKMRDGRIRFCSQLAYNAVVVGGIASVYDNETGMGIQPWHHADRFIGPVYGILSDHWPVTPHPRDATWSLNDWSDT